jgi:putative FmdB family regulatory protein|tara:strand:+ start:362 stop:607 length:246 start_codon:yes stop_codon:yes gene_type:complete
MPRYEYECEECSQTFLARHSIKEKLTSCKLCGGENCVTKLFGTLIPVKKQEAGHLVRSHIEESKQDLEQQKRESRRVEYDV